MLNHFITSEKHCTWYHVYYMYSYTNRVNKATGGDRMIRNTGARRKTFYLSEK